MINNIKRVFLGVMFIMQSAFAEKVELRCDDAKALTVKASGEGFTRISFKGDKLRDVMGLEEDVLVEKNEAEGILFLKNIKNKQTITLITESGVIQDLTLVPGGTTTMNIVLKPNALPKTNESSAPHSFQKADVDVNGWNAPPFLNTQEVLIQMIKHLYAGGGDTLTTERIRVSFNGLKAISNRRIQTHGFIGEVFTITNTESNTTILLEKDFFQIGDLALALAKKQLQVGESTSLFVIRKFI